MRSLRTPPAFSFFHLLFFGCDQTSRHAGATRYDLLQFDPSTSSELPRMARPRPSPPANGNNVPILLDRPVYGAHLERAVVYRLAEQEQRYQEQTHVRDVHTTVVLRISHGTVGDTKPDRQKDQPSQEQQIASLAAKLGPNRGHLAAVRAPGQVVLQRVKQERVVTVTAGDAAHARHREQRRRHRARRQIDDALAVGPRTGHPLGRALADEQTVAGTSDVLLARRRIPDGRGFIALGALDDVLFLLPGDVYQGLADAASYNHTVLLFLLIRRWYLVRADRRGCDDGWSFRRWFLLARLGGLLEQGLPLGFSVHGAWKQFPRVEGNPAGSRKTLLFSGFFSPPSDGSGW